MKNVTTLLDKDRLANAMDVELSDFEDDDEEDRPKLADQQNEHKLISKALTLRDFDEHVVFLAPLQYAGNQAENYCHARLHSCYGSNIYVASALQLDLFQKALIEQGAEIPMNQICELCFREEENISSVAFAYVKLQVSRNMTLGNWVWSYSSIVDMLQLFGCSTMCAPCEVSDVWSVENCLIIPGGNAQPVVGVYVENEAFHLLGVLLQLVEVSYNRQHERTSATLLEKTDAAKLLVVLMRLTCDATVQELHPGAAWSAAQAVLAYCRRLETAEYPTQTVAAAELAAPSGGDPIAAVSTCSSHTGGDAIFRNAVPEVMDAPPLSPTRAPAPVAYPDNIFHSPSQRDSQSQSQSQSLASYKGTSRLLAPAPSLVTSHHFPHATHRTDSVIQDSFVHDSAHFLSPPASDEPDQEESQLSSQLHDASIRGSPTLDAYVDAAEQDMEGAPARNIPQEQDDASPAAPVDAAVANKEVFTYAAEEVRALPAEGMSVVLLQALVALVRCREVTLLSLVNAAQVLDVSGDPAYQGLWEFFVRALLQYRIAPYFPTLPYTCAPCAEVGSGGNSGSSSGGSGASVGTPDNTPSICACMVAFITALTAQQLVYKNTPGAVSLWRDIRAVRAYFKLVSQYVLCRGLEVEGHELEDLEDACKTFRSKTTCMEMEDIIDNILSCCAMYLD